MIFKEGAFLLGVGIVTGLLLAVMMARLVANQMYGVSEHDPLTFILVSFLLGAISLLACWIAALRVLNVDPVIALRCE
jgi:ABC-type antimicrobial peptide transport system permease subunit